MIGVSFVLFDNYNNDRAGDIYRDPFLMYPGVADRKNLQPFYDGISPYIRNNDSDRLIFFESVTWTDELNVRFANTLVIYDLLSFVLSILLCNFFIFLMFLFF